MSTLSNCLRIVTIQILSGRNILDPVILDYHATKVVSTTFFVHGNNDFRVTHSNHTRQRSLTRYNLHVKDRNIVHPALSYPTVVAYDCLAFILKSRKMTQQSPFKYILKPSTRSLQLIMLLTVIGLSVWLISVRERAAELSQYGYPGIVLINAMASGTVLLPAPGVIFTYTFGGVFNPMLVGLAAAAGAAIGELTGYAAGMSGRAIVQNLRLYDKLLDRMKRHTRATVVVLVIMAAIPNPAFDLVGIAAGTLRVPLLRFFLSAFTGNLVKMLTFAYAGAYSFRWILPLG